MRTVPLLVVITLAGAGAGAGAAPAAAGASCRLPSGRVIAAGKVAELIALPTPAGAALYACIRRTGRKIALDEGYSDARLSGRWVAWQRRAGGDRRRIDVHDLRTGRERLVDGHVAGRALFLTTTGTIVWAQQLDRSVGVFANDVRRGGRLLGNGAVEVGSLRVSGGHVNWRQDGLQYTADVR
jgi:hypothetical protein